MRNLSAQLFIAFFMLALPLSAICSNDISVNFVNETSFSGIQDIAFDEDKPILITFHATWSSSCQKMRHDVFANEKVAEYMNDNFINYSANIESKMGSALAEYYKIDDLPTTLVISPSGHIVEKSINSTNPKLFLKWAKKASHTYIYSKKSNIGMIFHKSPVSLENDSDEEPYIPQMILPRIKQSVALNQ